MIISRRACLSQSSAYNSTFPLYAVVKLRDTRIWVGYVYIAALRVKPFGASSAWTSLVFATHR